MVDKIINSISTKLKEVFDDKTLVYTEPVEQDDKTSCFFICCETSACNQVMGKRYSFNYHFDIQYYPLNGHGEMHSVAAQLYDVLEYIDCETSKIKGVQMNYKIEQGVLHFYINYNIQIIKTINKTSMDELKLNNNAVS